MSMAETLHVRVVTPRREILDEDAEMVTAQGVMGQFGVLPKHIAFVTALDPGELSLREAGGAERRLAVKGGYAEVRGDVVTILADEALAVDAIDAAAVEQARERAAAAAAAAPAGHPDYDRAQREVRWADVLAAMSGRGR